MCKNHCVLATCMLAIVMHNNFCLVVMGWALASDSVEVTCISFVTPVLNCSGDDALHPTKAEIGALNSIIFIGMMVRMFSVQWNPSKKTPQPFN